MKRYSVFTILMLIGLCAVSPVLTAAPRPSSVPTEWQLDIDYSRPIPITVRDADGVDRLYWYVLYTVVNNSGSDRLFVPDILMYTDTGKTYKCRDLVYPEVFKAIQKRHSSLFLKDLTRIAGRLLQGDDNAVRGVAIFPNFDQNARSIDIFFGGFSGEAVEIQLPTPVKVAQPQNDGSSVERTVSSLLVRKTLKVTWEYPGLSATRQSVQPKKAAQTWVMR